MNSRLDAMLTLNSIPGNQQQQTQSIPASEEPSHINLLSGMHDWSVISPIRTMNSLTGVQGNISSVSEIRPRQRPIIPPVNLSFHRNPHLDGTMIAGPTDGPFVVVGDDYDDNSVLQRSQLPHNYSNQKASHEVFDSYESINPVSLEPLPQGFYTVVRSSEQFLELLRKTFVGWYLNFLKSGSHNKLATKSRT
ncbi:hypothetical protein BC830DRAFT_98424 [Chytriomyces sp. MP71]|nr:hypothetical protein BC830DRAFT_98424 [Chytriomyces sp. MP71]